LSLAIANQMMKYAHLPEYSPNMVIPKNSLMWWEQHLFSEQNGNKMHIGAHNVRNLSN
jgi:hypothetical protein